MMPCTRDLVSHQQLDLIQGLSADLTLLELPVTVETGDSLVTKLRKKWENARILARNNGIVLKNSGKWAEFGVNLAKVSADPSMVGTLFDTAFKLNPNVGADLPKPVRWAKQIGEMVRTLQQEFGMLSSDFGLTPATFVTEYNTNIRRFQKLSRDSFWP